MTDGSRPLLAAAWMTGAIVVLLVDGRRRPAPSAGELDTFEMMMYRSFIGLAVVLIVGLATGKLSEVRFDRLPLHLVRNLAHFTGQNLWFYSLTLITLAQVFALEFTSPIWVVVLAVLFLGERLTRIRVLAVALGLSRRAGRGAPRCGRRSARVWRWRQPRRSASPGRSSPPRC